MKKIIGITVVVLVFVIGITAYIHKGTIAEKLQLQERAWIRVKQQGEKPVILEMDTIKALSEKEFEANLKASGKEAVKHNYTGVPVYNVLKAANITIKEENQLVVTGIDGYTVALKGREVLDEDNIYLVYKMDGEPLGTKESGGKGPYQIVIRKDPFSQRWCKFVVELEVQ